MQNPPSSPLMSEHTPELYQIFCVFEDDIKDGFFVKLEPSATVYDLKKAIVQRNPNRLKDISARGLILYQVDIPGSAKAKEDVIKKRILDLDEEESLDPLQKLSQVYTTPPAEKTVHLIVQIPIQGEKGDSKS
jgi:hypothetical protein